MSVVSERLNGLLAVVKEPAGIHCRPATEIATVAQRFESEITLVRDDGPEADAKSVMQIMCLGAMMHTPLTIYAEGPDAEAAKEQVATIIGHVFDTGQD